MTIAARDHGALFSWGELRHTLVGTVIKDLAVFCSERGLAPDDALAVLEDPLFGAGLDEAFFELLAEDVERERSSSYAELAFGAMRRRGSPQARRTLECLLELGVRDARRAELYGRIGLEELTDEQTPLLAARCLDVIGRTTADRGDLSTAAMVLTEGADRARRAGDVELECDVVGAAMACRQRLGAALGALSLSERWVKIARQLGDPRRLAQALGKRGTVQMSLGREEAARADFEEALPAAVDAGELQMQSDWLGNLGILASIAGEYSEAIRRHTAALERSRELENLESIAQDLGYLSQAYWKGGEWDEALRHQREAVAVAEQRVDPVEIGRAREILAGIYRDLGYHEQAAAVERLADESEFAADAEPEDASAPTPDAFARPPEDPDLNAELDAAQGRGLDSMLEILDARIGRDPGSAVPYVKRGVVLDAFQRWEPALEAYEAAIERAPRWLIPHVNAINVWEALEDLVTPAERYERVAADDPFDPLPRTVLGRIYGYQGRHDEALRELREALRLAPETPDIVRELALELDKLAHEQLADDWAGAWATFEECTVLLERLPRLEPEDRLRTLADTARIYARMAEASTAANPPFVAWLGDRELDLWVQAIINLTEAAPRLAFEWPRRLLSYAVGLLVNIRDATVLDHMD